MDHYVGLDVLLEQTSVCIVDGNGKTLWQGIREQNLCAT